MAINILKQIKILPIQYLNIIFDAHNISFKNIKLQIQLYIKVGGSYYNTILVYKIFL